MSRLTLRTLGTLTAVTVLATACGAAPASASRASAPPVNVTTTKTTRARMPATASATPPTSTTPATTPSGPITTPAEALASQGTGGNFAAFPASNSAVVKFGQGPVDQAVAEMIKFSFETACNNTFVQLVHPTVEDGLFMLSFMDTSAWTAMRDYLATGNTSEITAIATYDANNQFQVRFPDCVHPSIDNMTVSTAGATPAGAPLLAVGMRSTVYITATQNSKPVTIKTTHNTTYLLVQNPQGGVQMPWLIHNWNARWALSPAAPDRFLSQE